MAKKTQAIVAVEADRIAILVSKGSKFKEKPTEQVVETLIDELESLLVTRGKEARADYMMMFWEAGKLLRDTEKLNKVSISALVSRAAMDNRVSGRHMGERNLWFAIRFYDYFPKFDAVYQTEHGEAVSLTKIKKMLVTPRPKKNKSLQEMAYDLVDKLGADQALKLVQEIEKEVKRREQHGA